MLLAVCLLNFGQFFKGFHVIDFYADAVPTGLWSWGGRFLYRCRPYGAAAIGSDEMLFRRVMLA